MASIYNPILASDIKLDDPKAVILEEDLGSRIVYTIYTTALIARSEASRYFSLLRREHRIRSGSSRPHMMAAHQFYSDEYPDGNNVYRFIFESA